MNGFDPSRIKVGLVRTLDDANEFWSWLTSGEHRIIGYDIETDGLDWYDGKIRLVQFGSRHEGYAIPYELYPGLCREALNYLMAKKILITGHNVAGFDLLWSRHHMGLVIDWSLVHDTMLSSALLDSAGSKALKDNSVSYVSPIAKLGQSALHDDMRRGGWNWATVPWDLPSYWTYGVLDTILSVNLLFAQLPLILEQGIMEAYQTERHVEKVLHQVSWNGLMVNPEHCRTHQQRLLDRSAEIQEMVTAEWGIENIGSGPQLSSVFQNTGVKLTRRTPSGKNWSMDKDSLDLIAAENGDHPLVKLVAEYRRSVKYAGYFDQTLRYMRSDGKVHPSYKQMQARTLRMSANDPPIQTYPRPDEHPEVRDSFMASEGHSYISADFSNVEARVFAILAKDRGMIQTFKDGIDLHCWTGGQMYNGGTPIAKSDPRRQKSKNSLFTCTPLTTKIVTRTGPKSHSELTLGEDVLAYDPITKTTQWTPLRAITSFLDQPLVRMSDAHHSVVSTADHRWFIDRKVGPRWHSIVATTEEIHFDDRVLCFAPLSDRTHDGLSGLSPDLMDWLTQDTVCTYWNPSNIESVGPEDVWCPTTDLGSWVAMDENDQIFITGNCLFGGGAEKLATTAGTTVEEAATTLKLLKGTFPSIGLYAKEMQTEAHLMAEDHHNGRSGIRLADGRILRLGAEDERFYAYVNYCLPRDTEVLTEHGWLRIDRVDTGTRVMGYKDGTLDYTTVTDTTKSRSRLVTLEHQMFNVRCTPNHRWLTDRGYQEAAEITDGSYLKISAPSVAEPMQKLRDSDVYVLAWVITDGHTDSTGRTMIHQKKQPHYDNIISSLDAYKVPYQVNKTMSNGVVPIAIKGVYSQAMWHRLGGVGKSGVDLDRIVLSMTPEQRVIFIDACCDADGTVDSRGHRVFNQSMAVNENIARAVQLACFLQGGHGFYSTGKNDQMTLRVDGQHPIRKRKGRGLRVNSDDHNLHTVWCLTTETSNFVIRQGRTVTITGNSIQGTARMILGQRLAALDNAGLADYAVAVIHDEVVFEMPDDIAEDSRGEIADHMSDHEMFEIPIVAAVGHAAKTLGATEH